MPSKQLSNNKSNININTITLLVITVFVSALVIILHYSMYTWTQELEKQGCECSDMWHRNIVHWLALILLILIPVNNSTIVGLSFIAYICIVIDYIRKLKQLECECSEDWKREYGYIFSVIYISLIAIIIFSGILGGLFIKSKLK